MKNRCRSQGQALAELAITLPVFLALVLGLLEGCRLIFTMDTVSAAAREAARKASVQAPYMGAPTCDAPVCPAIVSAFMTNVRVAVDQAVGVANTGTVTDVIVSCTAPASAPTGTWTTGNQCASNASAGNVVSVRVVLAIRPMTPIFAAVYPTELWSASTMRMP